MRMRPSSSSYPPLEPIQFHTDGRAGMTVWTNPFAFPSKTIRNPDENNRKWIWLAPWSTWSFTVRLTVTLMRVLGRDATDMASASATGVIYPMTWKQVPEDEPPDISGLPSIDHALYLFNTAKFHLGQQYRFFQDGSFEAQIHTFYRGDARAQAATSRIWFVQFLVVLAFGSAFLSKAQQPGEAPGSKYFVRAMSLLPPTASIWKGSLLACETLALVGLYFYSTNHRETALLYVGQALRIAQLEGIHTQLPEDELGRETVQRCRSLWCTIWIMDRHISTSLGLSMSTADCDFSGITGEPAIEKEEDTVLILQAKLSQLNWEILQTLYRGDRSPISVFLEKTRFILQTLAGHAQEIEQIITLKFGNSLETMPKGTRHITLLYHQCVIVATRPLLYSVLKERLDKLNGSNDGPNNFENFLALATTLISTGIKSAAKTLHILSREDTLLASFLPFDLEFTYGAALHLTMARALFPGPEEDATEMKLAKTILKEMISKGSDLAEARKKDLIRLEQLCADFTQKSEQQGMQALILPVPEISNSDQGRDSTGQSQVDGFVPPLRSHLPAEAAAIPPDFSEYSPETALHHQYMMENSAFLDDIVNQERIAFDPMESILASHHNILWCESNGMQAKGKRIKGMASI
ncbi:Zn(II)2Cys6 transcription factor [Plectosphaerella plurivora]|uniref:Zn(II)2Cys6 transcription factor n=1 Tax=Plectosphaerella plurivora TaxID=936078 RepID=A0A9P9A273_9PEZI|nr:Zn(II)2Cys6 transcription factor [Plectosphaerella plurivora]